jgi:hypothetical protein
VPDPDEGVVLVDRVPLGHAVDGRRRDQHDPPDAGLERGAERDGRLLDVDRPDCVARDLDGERRRGVDEDFGACHEPSRVGTEAHIAVDLLDTPRERRIVEWREIEDADGVPLADQAPGEVQAEEARAAGDRDEHGAER